MPFSFFTNRSRDISTRLRLVARGFQLSGIAAWTLAAAWTIAAPLLPHLGQPIRLYRWMFAPMLVYSVLAGTSMFLIGRALMRRQRWGAYLAGATLGIPLIQQLISPDAAILSVSGIVVSTLALCAIVTVWDELGTVRDAEFADPASDDENLLPKRNRGFGEAKQALGEPTPAFNEPRSQPLQSLPNSPTRIAAPARDPLTVNRSS